VEAIFSVLAIHHQIAPPTINLINQDPQCDLDYIPNYARAMNIKVRYRIPSGLEELTERLFSVAYKKSHLSGGACLR